MKMIKKLFALVLITAFISVFTTNSKENKPLAAYKTANLWHFIDYQGKDIFPPIELENVLGYNEGMIAVSKNIQGIEKWGFINLSGEFVIPVQYDKVHLFSNGFAVVATFQNDVNFPVQYKFINKKGKDVFHHTYIDVSDFSKKGLAYTLTKDKKSTYINTAGNVVIDLGKEIGNAFYNGIAAVSDEHYLYGFIDNTGKKIIDNKYPNAGKYYEGLIAIETTGKYAYIDINDSIRIHARFDYAHDFKEGRAFVGDLYPYRFKIRWGVIDTNGKFIANYKYTVIKDFSEGLAAVRDSVSWGYISSDCKYSIPSQFYNTGSFIDGLAWASIKNKRYGFIDKKGNYIIEVPRFKKLIDLRLNKRMY